MMSQLIRMDMKILKSLIRIRRGSGSQNISQASCETCPHCGYGMKSGLLSQYIVNPVSLPRYTTRQFSTKTTTNTLLSSEKKAPRKRRSKKDKNTTEIIQEAGNVVSEGKTKLLKVKPNDLASYLEKIISDVPRGLSTATSYNPRMMSYSTSSDHLSTVNFSSTPLAYSSQFENMQDSGTTSMCAETELESINPLEDNLEETIILNKKSSLSKNIIPGEKDLIDSEFDVEAIDLNSKIALEELDHLEAPQEDFSIQEQISGLQLSTNVATKKASKLAKRQASLRAHQRELVAKDKRENMQKLAREAGLNKSLVAYLDMCAFTGQLNRGLSSLNYYRHRNKMPKMSHHPNVTDVAAFDGLLQGFAKRGNIVKVKDIFRSIREDKLKPSVQSFAAVIECLGRQPPSLNNTDMIKNYLLEFTTEGYKLDDLFNKTVFTADQRHTVLQAIRRNTPDFTPQIEQPFTGYNCNLLEHLNSESTFDNIVSPVKNLISVKQLKINAKKQLDIELKGRVTVKSVEKKDGSANLPYYRKILHQTEENWSVAVQEALERNFVALIHNQRKNANRTLGLYPFLKVLKPEEIAHIIVQEIRKLAEGSETYSPSVSILYRELGAKVLSRYQVLHKQRSGILTNVRDLYQEYIEWYFNPTDSKNPRSIRNPRQKWQQLLFNPEYTGATVDIEEKIWPNSILSSIGRFLYGIIMRDIKINAQVMRLNNKSTHLVPAFYSIFRLNGVHLKEEIKPHPALVKLYQAASVDELTFDASLVPMLCPPLPWASIRTGGYLLTPAKIIRLPNQAHQQKLRLDSCSPVNLYPSLDSLNQLGAVPWTINHKVLDTVIQVFNKKGDNSLGIPPPPSECPPLPNIQMDMSRQDKLKVHKARLAIKRQKAEMYSLWCDALYRLSLANHFRDELFWFPHNMDFRGRVYPCPPHLNHLGADMARSILVFAQGKPLGPNGLDWLKTHLVNLTGLKKRDSVATRLKYAEEIMDDILDSADNPLTGRKWWTESEEPWQTLACCIEIANAIQSGDPENYVSHFPVHQDGSCNGLQHYAALGRDQAGAESVNLAPSELPQDVYSLVATLVEKLRDNDAQNGVEIAQVLQGFIKRKVIKQTVMTTVYGVTRYGARLQIAKQLKDIPSFPKEHIWPASLYLVGKTFDSLQEMFTSTKEIQDWFTECARLISQICGQNVEWVTPLGLPVVQPYFRTNKNKFEAYDPLKLPESHVFDTYERPNVMKQKNAFPPNFIHSLDSSHMMLTSLHTEQNGITFVSVHDCYWTHPCSVEIMNKVCREQFVALHSEPILEELSKFLVEKYSYRESELFKDGSSMDEAKNRLNQLLTEVPAKGSFDLKSILNSTYFFS